MQGSSHKDAMDFLAMTATLRHRCQITEAIIKNNVEELRRLLAIRLNANDVPYFDGEQIIMAVFLRRKEILTMLVNHEHQFPLNNCRSYEKMMHLAVRWGDMEIIQMIIRRYPPPNGMDDDFKTPMDLAIDDGRIDIVCLFLCTTHTFNPPQYLVRVQQALTKLRTLDIREFFNSEEYINETVSVDSGILPGWSLLHIAVGGQLEDMVTQLVNNGANISAKNAEGLTPVHLADSLNNPHLVRLMISSLNKRRVFVNTRDEHRGISFFHLSCKNGLNVSLIRSCFFNDDLEQVDINETSNPVGEFPGYTSLHFAIINGCVDIVTFLVKIKADMLKKSAMNKTALHLAYERGQEKLIKVLLENLEKYDNITDVFGLSHFHIACAYSPDVVRKFITAGHSHDAAIDNQAFKSAGFTPLHFAVQNNTIKSVEILLIETRVNVNARNACQQTALHMSVENHRSDISRLLILFGADPSILDNKRSSPLHLAYRKSQDDVAVLMLNNYNNFSENAADAKGISHFHIACRYGDDLIVAIYLHQWTIDINRPSGYEKHSQTSGQSPLHFAIESGNMKTIRLLLTHNAAVNTWNAKGETPLLMAIRRPNMFGREYIQMLLVYGADPNMPSSQSGQTALHRVILQKGGCGKILETLLAHKADVNQSCNQGNTPLHLACMMGIPEFVHILLDAGADVHAVNSEGWMPIHMLADCKYIGNVFSNFADTDYEDESWDDSNELAKFFDIIDALLDAGLESVDVLDSNGLTTSVMAKKSWNPPCLKALLLHDADMGPFFMDDLNDPWKQEVIDEMGISISIRRYITTYSERDKSALEFFKGRSEKYDEIGSTKAYNEELNRIRMVRLNSHVILSDVLCGDLEHLTMLSRNSELLEFVKSVEVLDEFPLYAYLLRANLKRGLRRRWYLERVQRGVDKMVGGTIPDLVFHTMNSFLQNDEKNYENLLEAMDC